jgi:hypothetical protein
VTEKSEAIACARRCQSSQLPGGGSIKNIRKKWRAKEEERRKGSLTQKKPSGNPGPLRCTRFRYPKVGRNLGALFHRSRVTRFAEFFYNCAIVYFGQFLKITKLSQILAIFSHGKNYEFLFDKNGLFYILCDFFTNSSGHSAPGPELYFFLKYFISVY